MDIAFRIFSISFLLVLGVFTSCHAQTKKTNPKTVGGACEGCEAIFEFGNKILTPIDTLPEFQNNEPKLKITGTVFHKDGKTPAENVIIYIYHTNRQGIYQTKGNETGWAKRHGFIRGWVKTGSDGKYTFYTFRPATYPDRSEPEHIHITVKEPDKNEYYLDDYFFDDDPTLSQNKRKNAENRGGSGVMKPMVKNGMLTIERNLILGKNIPNYE
jgi:protocatechuate 3,4-dioxygenase, beta subunit